MCVLLLKLQKTRIPDSNPCRSTIPQSRTKATKSIYWSVMVKPLHYNKFKNDVFGTGEMRFGLGWFFIQSY